MAYQSTSEYFPPQNRYDGCSHSPDSVSTLMVEASVAQINELDPDTFLALFALALIRSLAEGDGT